MGFKDDLITCRGPVAGFAAMGLYWGGFAALVPALKARSALSDEGFGLAMLIATCVAVAAILALIPLVITPWLRQSVRLSASG